MLTLHNAIPVLELCSVNEMFNYGACLGIAFWKQRMPDLLHCSQDYSYPPTYHTSASLKLKILPQCYGFYKKDLTLRSPN